MVRCSISGASVLNILVDVVFFKGQSAGLHIFQDYVNFTSNTLHAYLKILLFIIILRETRLAIKKIKNVKTAMLASFLI